MSRTLNMERDLLQGLMDNMPDWIYFKDRKSCFIKSNHAHMKLLNIKSHDELVGKTDFDFFPKKEAEKYFVEEQKVIRIKFYL